MPIINETIICGVNAKEATATSADILQGKTAVVGKELITGTMPEKSGQTVNGTFVSGTTGYITGKIPQEGHYTTNSRLKIPVTNLAAGNIKKGVNIGGVTGTLSPTNVITQVGINSFTLNIEVPSTSSSFGGYLKMGTCSGSGTWIFINSGQSKSFSITGGPSIPSGQYLNYSRIESGQFNTSVVVFELPGDFYTFRITSGRPSTNLLFKTIQIRKWFS